MRALKYYVASTLDGFIAHEDGSFDGFAHDEAVVADFFASFSTFGTVLMGRKTYDVGLQQGVTSPYPMMEQVVFSRSLTESPDPAVTLVRENGVEFVKTLKHQEGKPIWLCGGADLASQLFIQGLIDEVILKLNPLVFGKGIPLFAPGIAPTSLELKEQKVYPCGVMVLHYALLSPI